MDENYAQKSLSGKLALLRYRVRMSQGQVAMHLAVALTTVNNWETGVARPNAMNLQRVIAFYLQQGGFTVGKEWEEASQLWAVSPNKADFDAVWFQAQLTAHDVDEVTKSKKDILIDPTEASLLHAQIVQNDSNTSIEVLEQNVSTVDDDLHLSPDSRRNGQYAETKTEVTFPAQSERRSMLEINGFWIQNWLTQTWLHAVYI